MHWRRNILVVLIAVCACAVIAAEDVPSTSELLPSSTLDTPLMPAQQLNNSQGTAIPDNQSVHAGKSKEQLLAELKDIYSPAQPAWWPPAPGWWILFFLTIAGLVVCVQWLRKRLLFRRQNNWKKTAIHRYQQLCDQAAGGEVPATTTIAEASVLMRRISLTQLARRETASLTDEQWLATLDKIGQTNQYSQGAGKLLTRHPYMRPQEIDRSELDALLKLIKSTIDVAPNSLIAADDTHRQFASLRRESGVV